MSNTNEKSVRKPSKAMRAEAAAWIARLHGPERSPELEAGLRRWLAEDANHARAFERMTDAWEEATQVATARLYRVRLGKRSLATRQWARAAVVLLACGVIAAVAYIQWGDSSYATSIGEQRIVRLEDGSRVSLNSASRIAVEYSEAQRRVRLERGEAFFEVEHNAKRPFVVFAGEQQIAALGTSFSVRYERDQLAVVLVEGKVAVSGLASTRSSEIETSGTNRTRNAISEATVSPERDVVTLTPGQRLVIASKALPRVDSPRIEAVTAWRHGEVILEKTPLTDAAEEMNRYDQAKLVIEDPAVGKLLVSGIYRTGDSARFARAVAQLYGLTVVEERDRISLRREPSESR